MEITLISDTHGRHKSLILPKGEMIIHAGDVSNRGAKHEIIDFLNWFAKLDFKYKVFIAGNHDFFFEDAAPMEINSIIPTNVIYLNDSGIQIEGINIWGSPVQPWFFNWAFNRKRGKEIATHWEQIPGDTNILITHGPPFGIRDRIKDNKNVGCEELLTKISQLNLTLHVFGHIHEAYGQVEKNRTTFVNASVLNLRYQLTNDPVKFIY